MAAQLKVLVTGGNTGIGLALCKQLAIEHNIHVFLGSRDEDRGKEAIKTIVTAAPQAKVTLVVIDVSSTDSVQAAAASLDNEKPFHAIVNNAGIGLAHAGTTCDDIVNVNTYGAKRVVEAFLPLLNPQGGRIVGTSSGVASSYASNSWRGENMGLLPTSERAPLQSFDCTWSELESIMQREKELGYGEGTAGAFASYGLSKAVLTAYHMLLAKQFPNLVISTCSPGFINTAMTSGFGATLEPEQGTVSLKKCILGDLTQGDLQCKGWYYGSDGLRSPLNFMRNPGDPEFMG